MEIQKKKKRQRALCRFKYQYQQQPKRKKEKKKKKKTYQVWLSNGSGSTSHRRDTSSNMTELPVMVALVPHLSPLSNGSGSFHQFHLNNIELLLFNLTCISHDFILLVF